VPKLIKAFQDGTLAKFGVTNVSPAPEDTLAKKIWSDLESKRRRDPHNSKNDGPNR
jgi:hypothetical protein